MDLVSEIAIDYCAIPSDGEVEESAVADENLSRPSQPIARSVHSRPQDEASSGSGNPPKSSSSKRKQHRKAENGLRSTKGLRILRRRVVRQGRPKLRPTDDGGGEDLEFRKLMAPTEIVGRSDAADAPLRVADDEPFFVTAPETLAAADSGGGVQNVSDSGNASAFDEKSAVGDSPATFQTPQPMDARVPPSKPASEDLGFKNAETEVLTRCSVRPVNLPCRSDLLQSVMKTLLDVESGHSIGDENIIEVAKRAGFVLPQPRWWRAGGYS